MEEKVITIPKLNDISNRLSYIIITIGKIRTSTYYENFPITIQTIKDNIEYIQKNVLRYNKVINEILFLLKKKIDIYIKSRNRAVLTKFINGNTFSPETMEKFRVNKKLFDEGISMYLDHQSKEETKQQLLSESVPPLNRDDTIGLYIYCHGESVYTLSHEFKTFLPRIKILKYTAASLCETFISTSMQDKYAVLFIIILYNYFKSQNMNLFDNPTHSILLANYITCTLYGEYANICANHDGFYKNIPQENRNGLNNIISEFNAALTTYIEANEQLYTYPISNPATYKEIDNFEQLIMSIKTDVKHENILIHPCRVSYSRISAPKCNQPEDTGSGVQRDKYYSVEDEIETPTTLDIKILNSFTFGFDERTYTVVAGDSLLELLLKLNTENTTAMNQLKLSYETYRKGERKERDPEVIIDNTECDFDKCTMISSITVGIKETITSISLQFLLFFLEYIGVKKTTVYDFSCGCPARGYGEDEPDPIIVSALKAQGPTQSQVTLSQDFSSGGRRKPTITPFYSKTPSRKRINIKSKIKTKRIKRNRRSKKRRRNRTHRQKGKTRK